MKFVLLVMGLAMSLHVRAELPVALSDTIKKGSGVIEILEDVVAADLQDYLQSGTMFLGVDLNEAASGLESSTSVGVAIKDITLSISTTAGDFQFNDFYTNTTSMLMEQGAAASEQFYTLFGTAGGNQITGGISDFGLDQFDDVVELRNISFSGDILSASLNVHFLDTDGSDGNESFFDYSGGFEEFVIVEGGDATLLDNQSFGITPETSNQVSFALTVPSGTPEPMWFLVLLIPMLSILKGRANV
jgi:hypothetical protein